MEHSHFFASKLARIFAAANILPVAIATILFSAPAEANEPLSASAEKYVTCFEQKAIDAARSHVRDRAVVDSSVPKKVLTILVNDDLSKACSRLLAEAEQGDDFARAAVRGSSAVEAAANVTLAEGSSSTASARPGKR